MEVSNKSETVRPAGRPLPKIVIIITIIILANLFGTVYLFVKLKEAKGAIEKMD